jgi:hypothetical protein
MFHHAQLPVSFFAIQHAGYLQVVVSVAEEDAVLLSAQPQQRRLDSLKLLRIASP